MFKQLLNRWIWIYITIGAVFFVFFKTEPLASQISSLNYNYRWEKFINDKLNDNEGPSRYELNKGVEYYESLIHVLGPLEHVYANKGFCYYLLGDSNKATEMYDKAIALSPQHYWYYWDKAVISFQQKHYDIAELNFKKSIDLIPETLQFYAGLVSAEKFEYFINPEDALSEIFFLYLRAEDDKSVAFEALSEIYMIRGNLNLAKMMKSMAEDVIRGRVYDENFSRNLYGNTVMARNAKGELQLHFHVNIFNRFFLRLRMLEFLQSKEQE